MKVHFPKMIITASRTRGKELMPNQKAFIVAPKTTKHEIKEYLTKVYGMDVRKVTTANYDGKVKRAGRNYAHVYREKAYKKAIVTIGDGPIDLGPYVRDAIAKAGGPVREYTQPKADPTA